jgi:hypothetical protein
VDLERVSEGKFADYRSLCRAFLSMTRRTYDEAPEMNLLDIPTQLVHSVVIKGRNSLIAEFPTEEAALAFVERHPKRDNLEITTPSEDEIPLLMVLIKDEYQTSPDDQMQVAGFWNLMPALQFIAEHPEGHKLELFVCGAIEEEAWLCELTLENVSKRKPNDDG